MEVGRARGERAAVNAISLFLESFGQQISPVDVITTYIRLRCRTAVPFGLRAYVAPPGGQRCATRRQYFSDRVFSDLVRPCDVGVSIRSPMRSCRSSVLGASQMADRPSRSSVDVRNDAGSNAHAANNWLAKRPVLKLPADTSLEEGGTQVQSKTQSLPMRAP